MVNELVKLKVGGKEYIFDYRLGELRDADHPGLVPVKLTNHERDALQYWVDEGDLAEAENTLGYIFKDMIDDERVREIEEDECNGERLDS